MKLKFASAIALCGFSVVALVLGTVAWFTAARVKNNQQDSISVVNPSGLFKQMTIHNVVNIAGNVNDGYVYQFDQTAQGTILYDESTHKAKYQDNTNISMGVYDLLDRHHPVLLLIQLTGEITTTSEIGVKVTAKTESNFIGLNTGANPIANDGSNPLSSVVESFSYSYTETALTAIKQTNGYSYSETVDDEVVTHTYDTINVPVSNTTVKFTEFLGNGNYSKFNHTLDLYTAPTSHALKYVAIVFDFYEEALEYIYNTFLGNEVLEGRVGFTCDWEMII